VDGKRNGEGTQRFADGSLYVGEWKQDRRNRRWRLHQRDGKWTYDGEWLDDKRQRRRPHGRGEWRVHLYRPICERQQNGPATVQFGDGRIFRGPFVNDQQKGPGELTFKDGRKIIGEFLENMMPNGQAVEESNTGTLNGTCGPTAC
jgi:hypothetical protein